MEWRGDVAQLARAPALQAGGRGFESHRLHQSGSDRRGWRSGRVGARVERAFAGERVAGPEAGTAGLAVVVFPAEPGEVGEAGGTAACVLEFAVVELEVGGPGTPLDAMRMCTTGRASRRARAAAGVASGVLVRVTSSTSASAAQASIGSQASPVRERKMRRVWCARTASTGAPISGGSENRPVIIPSVARRSAPAASTSAAASPALHPPVASAPSAPAGGGASRSRAARVTTRPRRPSISHPSATNMRVILGPGWDTDPRPGPGSGRFVSPVEGHAHRRRPVAWLRVVTDRAVGSGWDQLPTSPRRSGLGPPPVRSPVRPGTVGPRPRCATR